MNPAEYEIMYRVEDAHWWYIGLRNMILDFLTAYAPNRSPLILDAGCGTGAVLKALGDRLRTAGIDFSVEAIRFCRIRGLVRTAAASVVALPFPNESFDVVISCDVLCNRSIRDKGAALCEMGRVLKPGGVFFLNLPAYQWMLSSDDSAVQQDRRFTRRELRRLLCAASLKPVRMTHWNSLLLPPIILIRMWRKIMRRSTSDLDGGSGVLANLLFGCALAAERGLIRAVSAMPFGLSIFAVARKEGLLHETLAS